MKLSRCKSGFTNFWYFAEWAKTWLNPHWITVYTYTFTLISFAPMSSELSLCIFFFHSSFAELSKRHAYSNTTDETLKLNTFKSRKLYTYSLFTLICYNTQFRWQNKLCILLIILKVPSVQWKSMSIAVR